MQKKHLKKISALLLLLGGLGSLHAQSATSASGGEGSGSGGSASYSIGQPFYLTKAGLNGSVEEGVQQAYEITTVSQIKDAKGISLAVTALPNPVMDDLILTVSNDNASSLRFQLYDVQGKLLQNGSLSAKTTRISMSGIAPATYFLKVTQGDIVVKTFKVIKK